MKKLYTDFAWYSKKYVYIIPPIHILLTLIISFSEISDIGWIRHGNSTGYSMLTSFVYIVVFIFSGKYCLFTRLASIGLFAIATFNFIASFIVNSENYPHYENLFSKIIVFFVLGLLAVLSLTLKKK